MKFQLAINMERLAPDIDMSAVAKHTLEMVQMADRGGFHIAWAAEHHALEMTIAPDPFQICAWWAAPTNRIRIGVAVAVAPYWHPIKLAGAGGTLDIDFNTVRLEPAGLAAPNTCFELGTVTGPVVAHVRHSGV